MNKRVVENSANFSLIPLLYFAVNVVFCLLINGTQKVASHATRATTHVSNATAFCRRCYGFLEELFAALGYFLSVLGVGLLEDH